MKNKTPINVDDFLAHKLHQQVRQGCLEALHKNAISTLMANVLVSIVAAIVIWIEVSSILVFYWLGTNLLVNGLRFVVVSMFPKDGAEPSEYKRWSIYYSIGATIGGAVWGAAAIVFMTPDLYVLDAFIIICIMGMVTGAASSLAPHFPTFIAFVMPTLLPLIFQLAVRGDLINSVLAAMGVLFSVALIIASRNSNLILRASLEEKFKSKELARDLKIEHDKNEQSERRFKGVVENVGDAIFIHDRFGKITEVNQNACEILGYRRDELTLLSMLEVEAGHNEIELRNLWDMGATNPSKFPMTLEGLNRRKSGTVFPVEVRISILPTDGDILYVASVRDISERKEAERQLKETMEIKSQFVSTVSHELRTPMACIKEGVAVV
ncbi:MAG: PAS domain S-box protein, partial [Rhodospirillaceae bacterium]|nr:PAS domain S-box protein [Rhodospirillaceae bacterium]